MAIAASAGMFLLTLRASAAVYITEFCSDTGNNEHFEFVEVTNVGAAPVDMTGWSEDDSGATANKSGHSLSGLGTLAPGESGIITEAAPTDFRAYWNLSGSVPVVGPYSNDNLSTTADSITLFNAGGQLVDRLDYSTTNGGSADMYTRNAPLSALGQNDNARWISSFAGDPFGSFRAPGEAHYVFWGNPGAYPVPEPAALLLLAPALIGMLVRRRRTKALATTPS